MSDWQQMGIANVTSRMRDIETSVASMADDVPMLIEAVTRLDADIERLISSRRDTLSTLTQHDDTLRDLATTVRRLALQVAWIEQHLRSSGSARTVDLDRADPELVGLAATAEAGRAAKAVRLGAAQRAALLDDVTGHQEARAAHLVAVRSVLDVCARLAGPPAAPDGVAVPGGAPQTAAPDGAARRQARADYLTAKSRHADTAAAVASSAAAARAARRRLAADDAERQRTSSVVADGEHAERELLTRLRTRVAGAVGDGALLPAWLTGPLGPMPAAGAAERWTEVAAGLLAYRITYGVSDPADATGELPSGAGERRRRWHADLGRGVRDLRR